MSNKWQLWFQGFVTLHVKGRYLPHLINKAIRENIEVSNIHWNGEDEGFITIPVKDFHRLRPMLKDTETRIRIMKKKGWPFVAFLGSKRKGFLLGAIFFIVFLYMLSSMVWKIDVVGTEKISKKEVYQAASQIGIRKGAFQWKIPDFKEAREMLLSQLSDAAWVGVEKKGTKIIITVVEKVKPEKNRLMNPRHLVAKKKAMIQKIIVEKGIPQVKPSQWVSKGQILVSGLMGNEDNQEIVVAEGKVLGEIWYESEINLPLSMTISEYTGNKKNYWNLLLGNYKIILSPEQSSPYPYFVEKQSKRYLQFFKRKIPFGIEKKTFYEVNQEELNTAEQKAYQLGLNMAREKVLKQSDHMGYIKDEKVLHRRVENGKVYMKIYFAVIEDIAEEQPIITESESKQGD
ncbi:sporulation protein YqfD [Microaerobacter geothermalis]|uniref:sporulation protein YqfD n=1 Tax=Microaerobacter geothermalis TaxID=674972 RepID=UPI001F43229B|nr:sporulation protein YqfD [Microaerobacter geothermalis]MCF6092826.1 sporulation protein YqfD [Microaerobacter geothermalis]